jgi:hypothetical protein
MIICSMPWLLAHTYQDGIRDSPSPDTTSLSPITIGLGVKANIEVVKTKYLNSTDSSPVMSDLGLLG